MAAFLVAFMASWLGIFLFNLPSGFGGALARERGLSLSLMLVMAPLMSAWFTAIVVQYRWPRQLLTAHTRSLTASVIRGFIAGVGSIVTTALLLLGGTGHLADWTITAVSSALATGLTLQFSRKVQPGYCRICNYDLCSSLEFGRCPECGTVFA